MSGNAYITDIETFINNAEQTTDVNHLDALYDQLYTYTNKLYKLATTREQINANVKQTAAAFLKNTYVPFLRQYFQRLRDAYRKTTDSRDEETRELLDMMTDDWIALELPTARKNLTKQLDDIVEPNFDLVRKSIKKYQQQLVPAAPPMVIVTSDLGAPDDEPMENQLIRQATPPPIRVKIEEDLEPPRVERVTSDEAEHKHDYDQKDEPTAEENQRYDDDVTEVIAKLQRLKSKQQIEQTVVDFLQGHYPHSSEQTRSGVRLTDAARELKSRYPAEQTLWNQVIKICSTFYQSLSVPTINVPTDWFNIRLFSEETAGFTPVMEPKKRVSRPLSPAEEQHQKNIKNIRDAMKAYRTDPKLTQELASSPVKPQALIRRYYPTNSIEFMNAMELAHMMRSLNEFEQLKLREEHRITLLLFSSCQ